MQKELENGTFILNENGIETEYTTILTFYNQENQKNYVVYTDNTIDEIDNLNLFASSYDPNDEEFNLYPVMRDDEWQNINEVLNNVVVWGGQ